MQIDKSTFLQKLTRCYERLSLATDSTPDKSFEDFLKIFLVKVYYDEQYGRDMILDIALDEDVLTQFESIRRQCNDKLYCEQYFSQYELYCKDSTALSMAFRELKGFCLLELVDTNAMQAFEAFLQKYMRTRQSGLYTHPTLVQFVMGLLTPLSIPNFTGRLGDPAGGCGQYLTYYVRMGAHKMFSIGATCDDPLMVVAIRINLYIQGIRDHVADIRCREKHNLSSAYYDIVASSIPDEKTSLIKEAIDACVESGRIALVTIRKVLFDEEFIELQQYILQNTRIESVTLLPENVFFSGSSTSNHCVVTMIKKNTTCCQNNYKIAVSSVTDAGVSVLGLSTHNKQLMDVEHIIKEWQRTGIEIGGDRTIYVDSEEFSLDNILTKLKNKTTRYNNKYAIVQLSELLNIANTQVVRPQIGRTYKQLLIDFDNSPKLRDMKYEVGNQNQLQLVTKGQFVIGNRNSSSYSHIIVPASRRTITIEPSWSVFDINSSMVDPMYLHYILDSPAIERQLEDYRSINRNIRLGLDQIMELIIPLPPIEEQRAMIKDIALYSTKLERTKKQLKESKETFYKSFEQ